MSYSELKKITIIESIKELKLDDSMRQQILQMPKGEQRLGLAESNASVINAFKIKYRSTNGNLVTGYIVEPKEITKPAPVIIPCRGGTGSISQWEDSHMFSPFVAKYALNGYITITTQYSGNDGSEGQDEFGGRELEDVLTLKNIINQYNLADNSRVGISGGSRGGLMVYQMLRKVDWLKGAIIFAAPTNIAEVYSYRPDMLEFHSTLYNTQDSQELKKRSPIFWANELCKTTPILLVHGTGDGVDRADQSLNIAQELYKYKVPFDLRIFAGADHRLTQVNEEFSKIAMDFLNKYVRDEFPLPDLNLKK